MNCGRSSHCALITHFRKISSTDSTLIPETENPHPGGASVTHEVVTLTHSIDIDPMKYRHIKKLTVKQLTEK